MKGWVGFDLDGTLAKYDVWRGVEHIGEPVPRMVEKVKSLLAQGINVKIFTARVCRSDAVVEKTIRDWCMKHIGCELEMTCVKDYDMIELYDDRCIQIVPNTGMTIKEFYEKEGLK